MSNLRVLVTRPQEQGQRLCARLRGLGAQPTLFPTITIAPPDPIDPLHDCIDQLDRYDTLIFVSPNAVKYSAPLITARWPKLPAVSIAAIGDTTADTLEQQGIPVHNRPKPPFNSESLLKTTALQSVAGFRILLFCAEGGREILANTLRTRDAIVDKAIAYRRLLPVVDPEPLITDWETHAMDAVICTSVGCLENLAHLLGKSFDRFMPKTPLVVISQRMVNFANSLGLERIHLANGATDQALIDCLLKELSDDRKRTINPIPPESSLT